MGCVSSRCLYYPGESNHSPSHHSGGGGRTPLLRRTPLRRRSRCINRHRHHNHNHNHHQHLVALTSTTYGLLRWNSHNSSSSLAQTATTTTEEKQPVLVTTTTTMEHEENQTSTSEYTPFFDTTSVVSSYEDCYTCTDKEVVVLTDSRTCSGAETSDLDVSGAPSVSSSSSCVRKLVSLEPSKQPEVINIWELMEGLEEGSIWTPLASSPPSPSRRKASLVPASNSSKRRVFPRSVSLSSVQAAKKLESVFTIEGISPPSLEKVLKDLYDYYINNRHRNRLGRPLSSPTSPSGFRSHRSNNLKKPKMQAFVFGDKENSAPKFDSSPASSMRKKTRPSTPTFRRNKILKAENSAGRGGSFSFSVFTTGNSSLLDYKELRPATPVTRRMATPRTPLSPVVAKPREESPLFRGVTRDKRHADVKKSSTPCCKCYCHCNSNSDGHQCNKPESQSVPGAELKSTTSGGPVFDPELLASIERAFQNVSAEDWHSGKEDFATCSSGYSSSNEEVPLMSSKRPPRSSTAKGNKCTTPGSGASLLWDSFWSLRDSLTASGTAKKISFSKVSPLAHPEELEEAERQPINAEQEEEEEEEAEAVSNPLESFRLRCPPGGDSSVVLYCTSLRGIRKTYEDCHGLQMILRSLGVCIDERDISMHSDFRSELKELLDGEPVSVPKLFIRGRYIGGADDVRKLHEEGQLVKMLDGIPKDDPFSVCDGCGGLRFIPCLECSGSCKLVLSEDRKGTNQVTRCPDCNENGLIRCPICC